MPVSVPTRAFRVRPLGGVPVLVALLLGLLQVGTPLAHALLHLAAAQAQVREVREARQVRQERQLRLQRQAPQFVKQDPGSSPSEFRSALTDERACPFCAADETPALPGSRPYVMQLHAAPALLPGLAARERSSEPLQVFCRPPPAAV